MAKKKKKIFFPRHQFVCLARVERDELTGSVSLQLIKDTEIVELAEGAEYLTICTVVDPFVKPAKRGDL